MHDVVETFLEAFQCLGAANFKLCYRHKESMRPSVSWDYVNLYAPSVPYTNELFWDDITAVIKDISDVNQVRKKINPAPRGARKGGLRGRTGKYSHGRNSYERGRGQGHRDSDEEVHLELLEKKNWRNRSRITSTKFYC